MNDSDKSFTVPGRKIRFGLSAIKGLGEAALDAILEARQKRGPFSSLYDFCERVSLKQLNKKTLETLVRSGAFDCFTRPRAQLCAALARALEAAKSVQKDEAVGQASLFGAPALAATIRPKEQYDEEIREWPELERLEFEKEAIGFYITGHPLDRYQEDLRRLSSGSIGSLEKKGHRAEVVLGCVVSALRERPLRDGSGRMAFVTLEDLTGSIEAMVSANVFGQYEAVLKSNAPLLVKVAVSVDRDEEGEERLRVRCLEARPIADARLERTRSVVITVDEPQVNDRNLKGLKAVFDTLRGSCAVRLLVRLRDTAEVEMSLPESVKLQATDEVLDKLEQLFGVGAVRFC